MVKWTCICGYEYNGITFPEKCPRCGIDKFELDRFHDIEE